jgi:hypothetical protein
MELRRDAELDQLREKLKNAEADSKRFAGEWLKYLHFIFLFVICIIIFFAFQGMETPLPRKVTLKPWVKLPI